MQHSKVVGGSTAKRVINCPGSVALVAKMPPQASSKYAEEGTLLHGCMEDLLADGEMGDVMAKHNLTPEQAEKLQFCLDALDQIDPEQKMQFVQEVEVEFEGVKALEGVFGNADLIGRLGDRAVVLDWKFGDGVMVEAEENEQGLFYAAAAMKTSKVQWAFDGAEEIEIVIVQPPHVRRWVTTFKRVHEFERELVVAVQAAKRPDAPVVIGDHCRWCTAKPICPQVSGAVDRVTHTALATVDPEALGQALALAERLEDFIADARKLAQARLEKGMPVPGYKLVPKRAVRQWVKPAEVEHQLIALGLPRDQVVKEEIISPAQAEKVLKKSKMALPDDLVVAVSSGNTLAPESDPRPAVVLIGQQLVAALSKIK
jgi:hypothetical protein